MIPDSAHAEQEPKILTDLLWSVEAHARQQGSGSGWGTPLPCGVHRAASLGLSLLGLATSHSLVPKARGAGAGSGRGVSGAAAGAGECTSAEGVLVVARSPFLLCLFSLSPPVEQRGGVKSACETSNARRGCAPAAPLHTRGNLLLTHSPISQHGPLKFPLALRPSASSPSSDAMRWGGGGETGTANSGLQPVALCNAAYCNCARRQGGREEVGARCGRLRWEEDSEDSSPKEGPPGCLGGPVGGGASSARRENYRSRSSALNQHCPLWRPVSPLGHFQEGA